MRSSVYPIVALAAFVTASCTAEGPASSPKPLTEKQAEKLDKALKGKVAGKPVNCITNIRSTSFTRVSDDILLYRQSRRLVYQNRLGSSCPGLARDDDIIVTRVYGSRYCKGDIITLVDRNSGFPGPSCTLGQFIPYRPAEG